MDLSELGWATLAAVIADLLQVGLLLLVLAANRDAVARHWRLGLLVAMGVTALGLPDQLVTFRALRLGMEGLQGAVTGLLACALLGEWERSGADSPVLWGPTGGRGWRLVLAAVVGVMFALLTVALFRSAGVGPSELPKWWPESDQAPVSRFASLCGAILQAPIGEEIAFRGAFLAFLMRRWGRSRGGAAAAATAVTLLWAALHIAMTDAPLLKMAEMVPLGFLLVVLARRWGLATAMATHIALNLTSTVATLVERAFSAP